MSPHDDLRNVKSLYNQFSQDVADRADAFFEGKYASLARYELDKISIETEYSKKNSRKIEQISSFAYFAKDVFELPFVKKICQTAGRYGFQVDNNLFNQSNISDFLENLLLGNLPIDKRKPLRNQSFKTLAFFRKRPVLDNSTRLPEIQILPLIKVRTDEENRIAEICPQPIGVITDFLSMIFKES
jgi:hypothetical protein